MARLSDENINFFIEDWPVELSKEDQTKIREILSSEKYTSLNQNHISALIMCIPYAIDAVYTSKSGIQSANKILKDILSIEDEKTFSKSLELESTEVKNAANSLHDVIHNKTLEFSHTSTGTFETNIITSNWKTQKNALENIIGGQLGQPTKIQLKAVHDFVTEMITFYISKSNQAKNAPTTKSVDEFIKKILSAEKIAQKNLKFKMEFLTYFFVNKETIKQILIKTIDPTVNEYSSQFQEKFDELNHLITVINEKYGFFLNTSYWFDYQRAGCKTYLNGPISFHQSPPFEVSPKMISLFNQLDIFIEKNSELTKLCQGKCDEDLAKEIAKSDNHYSMI